MPLSPEVFPRCLLFVPGSRPERFAKAAASGADAVVIDLEDGVGAEAKEAARRAVAAFLPAREKGGPLWGLRINPPDQPEGRTDLAMLVELGESQPDFLMLPKFEAHAPLRVLRRALGAHLPPLIPLVESPRGVLDLDRELGELSRFAPLAGVMLGGFDLAAALGAAFAYEPLLVARSLLCLIARAHGLSPIDSPFLAIAEAEALREETRRSAALGFEAKAAIHPAQVSIVQAVFTPSAEAVAEARRIVAAAAAAHGEAVRLEGRLIDRPVVLAARRTLGRAGEVPLSGS